MQDRYTGDIGDFVKYGLLRALIGDGKLGVAWYLYPNEGHNKDGKHVKYLNEPDEWKELDADLYLNLKNLVSSGSRSVSSIENSGLLPKAIFYNTLLTSAIAHPIDRGQWRHDWFQGLKVKLSGCDIVFADPDNGLCADDKFSLARRKDWKRMPLVEAKELAKGRTAILYHHNSRFPGGHRKEIEYWMDILPRNTHALYWRRVSNRTFFIVNPTFEIEERLRAFAARWAHSCELISTI